MHRIAAFFQGIGVYLGRFFFKKTDQDAFLYYGSRIIPKGHTVFEYNVAEMTLDIPPCTFEDGKKTIVMQKGCMYVSALRRQGAYEKLKKRKLKVLPGKPKRVQRQPAGEKVFFKQLAK